MVVRHPGFTPQGQSLARQALGAGELPGERGWARGSGTPKDNNSGVSTRHFWSGVSTIMNPRSTSIPLGVALSVGLALAWPALGSAATCTVSPVNPTINMGQSVSWTNTRSGFPSGTYTYAWTFPGGNPATSTSSSRSVSYANAGTSTTSLRVTRGGTSATCTSTVTVRDTQAPTVPGGFTATAAGATQVNLAWSASTDNVGGDRLPRGALHGLVLYQFRPDRHPDGHQLQRHRPHRQHHLPLPRAGGGRGRQSEQLTPASATPPRRRRTPPRRPCPSAARPPGPSPRPPAWRSTRAPPTTSA